MIRFDALIQRTGSPFLGRRCSSRGWTDPALSDPANISPARRYATVLVVAPTRLSFARKPLRAELVSRSTCARSGIPERRANKISTCEIYARFFFSTWKAIPTGKVWTDVVRRVFYLSANFPYGRFRLPVN